MLVFTDGSDLVGIQHPLHITYMKYLRYALIIIGAWPGKLFGEKDRFRYPFKCYNICLTATTFTFQFLYAKYNTGKLSFFEMGQTYITVLVTAMILIRFISLLSKNYDNTFGEFVNDIHLFRYRNESEHAMKASINIHLFIHKLSHFFTIYAIGLAVFVAIFFNITPIYVNISNGGFSRPLPTNITYEHSVYYQLPFDYQHDFNGFFVIFLFNLYVSLVCGMIICCYDLVLSLFVFHLWGHLKILIHKLEHFPRPGYKGDAALQNMSHLRYSNEEMMDVSTKLRDIVNHHRLILRYTENISTTCGLNVAVYYVFHQISGCLLFLECSMDSKAMVRFGPLTVGLTQLLIQISVIFELLSAMNDPLIRAAYNVPWECMDDKNRKLVLMMLRQTQIPLGLKALGMVEVGCRTMATILKTTLSYFLMLRTVASNE